MESERTFGIEIECVSKISRDALADKINQAISPFGHTCSKSEWMRNTDQQNFTHWVVKTDATVHTHNVNQFPYDGIEIVSPILKGEVGLKILQAVCSVTEQHCTANKSCGLHVHHGITHHDNLGNIVIGWLRSEKTWYECLPSSRRDGHHAMPLHKRMAIGGGRRRRRRYPHPDWNPSPPVRRSRRTPSQIDNVRGWWDANVGTRYAGLNLESYWLRGTVEVRAAAGTVEFQKIANWVKVTQKMISKTSQNPSNFHEGIDNLLKALNGECIAITAPQRGNNSPRPTRKTRYALAGLENCTIQQLEVALRDACPEYSNATIKAQAYRFKKAQTPVTPVTLRDLEADLPIVPLTDDLLWLKGRHEVFARRAA